MDLVSDADRRKVLVVVPEPVDERLERLLRVARSAGMQVSRSQMVAALIAAAPTSPDDIVVTLRGYLSLELPAFTGDHPQGDLPIVRHPGVPRGPRRPRERNQPSD